MSASTLKADALAEIAKIKNAAVAEYLKLKVGHYSLTVVVVVAVVVAVLAGFVGHKL